MVNVRLVTNPHNLECSCTAIADVATEQRLHSYSARLQHRPSLPTDAVHGFPDCVQTDVEILLT
jgi:hypothetical protein